MQEHHSSQYFSENQKPCEIDSISLYDDFF